MAARRRAPGAMRLLVPLLLLAGCGFPHTAQERGAWFFQRGESWIVDALEETDAGEERVEAAREVLGAREPEVTDALGRFFAAQQDMLGTLASGAPTAELLAQQQEFEDAHVAALRAVGEMHAELEGAVGEGAWRDARARMRERVDDRMGEDG